MPKTTASHRKSKRKVAKKPKRTISKSVRIAAKVLSERGVKHCKIQKLLDVSDGFVTKWARAKSPTIRRKRKSCIDEGQLKELCVKERFGSAAKAAGSFKNPKTGKSAQDR